MCYGLFHWGMCVSSISSLRDAVDKDDVISSNRFFEAHAWHGCLHFTGIPEICNNSRIRTFSNVTTLSFAPSLPTHHMVHPLLFSFCLAWQVPTFDDDYVDDYYDDYYGDYYGDFWLNRTRDTPTPSPAIVSIYDMTALVLKRNRRTKFLSLFPLV